MNVVAGVAHAQAVALPLLQMEWAGTMACSHADTPTPLIAQRLNPFSAAFSFANVMSNVSSGAGAVAPAFAKRA